MPDSDSPVPDTTNSAAARREPVSGPGSPSLSSLWMRFVRYGLLAWGGPVAQIDLLRRELVEEERWVDSDRFIRVLALYQALPGPEATELCVYFGQRARGRIGGVVAGIGFLLPGVLLVLAAATAYQSLGVSDLAGEPALVLVQAGAAAIVLRAAVRIAGHSIDDRPTALVAAGALVSTLAGAAFWLPLVVGAAALEVIRAGGRRLGRAAPAAGAAIAIVGAAGAIALAPDAAGSFTAVLDPTGAAPAHADGGSGDEPDAPTHVELGTSGITAGALTFGGAYTAIPFVHRDAVERGGWIDEGTFLDSLAVGAVLPAPLVAFVTFIGYISGGFVGAALMTIGIFLPAFALTLLGHEQLEQLVDSPRLHPLLDGTAAAVAGIVLATALAIGISALGQSLGTAIFGFVAAGVMFRFSRPIVVPFVLVAALILGAIWSLVGM